ncbi:hypothetical protein M0R89_20475 (plasmid) [Halorussus limi]|uniref:Uncharacterized protein n=1 Tax=Halorussus limi TaxID=2938695 RepID=A0A8U0I1Q3_9EURY|nr:hypothetical protein [Halorussus limi]UPV76846.1 hypothetical protein M0R89_20475 [Halorussus limi]
MPDTLAGGGGRRRVVAIALVGLLVAFSGCAGFGGGVSDGTSTENGTTTAGEPTTEPATGESTVVNGTDETTTANDSTGTTATNDSSETTAGDGHSHSHGGETTDSEGSDDGGNDSESANATGDLSGKMTVVVAGTELPLDELSSGDRVSIAADDEHSWRANSSLTLAAALSSFGVEASADAVSYDGETYREATNGTEIHYRVNGEEVDPESYTLGDGDQIWVTVETADANYSVPGTYIDADQQHIHGPMTFVVDGEKVDFSAERFQSGHRHFHFEGGHANPWHAHSWSVTLQYGLNTLSGINVTDDSVTYNGTTYRRGAANTSVSITVNGEAVDPSEYFLKDGDEVRVVVEKDDS